MTRCASSLAAEISGWKCASTCSRVVNSISTLLAVRGTGTVLVIIRQRDRELLAAREPARNQLAAPGETAEAHFPGTSAGPLGVAPDDLAGAQQIAVLLALRVLLAQDQVTVAVSLAMGGHVVEQVVAGADF